MGIKNIKSLIIILMIICMSASVFAEQIGSLAQLSFTLISQNPDPVEPGNIVDLRWKIENTGGGSAEDVQVELVADYPFSIYSGDLTKNLGSIQGQQTGDKGIIVLYKVRVDENAVEGTNEIKLKYKTSKTGWVELDPFDINIQTSDATLSIEQIEVEPDVVAPGEILKASLKVTNLADSLLKDITVKLDLSSAALPFAPIQSITEKRIKQISSGSSADVSYNLIVEPDAALGVYKIPIFIKFNDNLGNSYNKSDLLGVVVGAVPDLSYYIDSTTINTAGNKGEITIKFVNKGLSDIKFLNIRLMSNSYYTILSPEEVYIGNIDSDDYETADFDLFVKQGAPKEFSIPLEISYKDSNNKDYRKDTEVKLKMYGEAEAVQLGIEEKDNKLGVIISVIVVVIGIVIYILVRKRKKK
jgi:hypothetical protein